MAHSFQATMFLRSTAVCAFIAGWLCEAQAEEAQTSLAGTMPASTLDSRPHIDISNGSVSAKVFPPGDASLYQGTRFDHAGVILHITYKGQDYSQYWFDRYATDPLDNAKYPPGVSVERSCCAVSGPVEEFAPVGFDEAGIGGTFLKPGIGILKRDAAVYSQFVPFPILNEGRRTITSSAGSVRFTQDIHDEKSGYGYSYTKVVQLTPGLPQMTIAHVLRNTGSKAIITTVYNHNFLTLSPGNENISITAPFLLRATLPLQSDVARVEGKSLRYVAPVPQGVTVTSPISGFGSSASDYDFRIVNSVTGFGVRMRADQPVDSINFWSIHTVLGWEPYIAIALKPGETKRWTNTYDYFGPGEG
jgi:hypothetical protein